MRPLYLTCPGNENNASARVCYCSQNTSQNQNWIKTQISKEEYLQISKMGAHGQKDIPTDWIKGGINRQQLKFREGETTIHLLLI